MLGKIFAGLVMGIVVAILVATVVGLGAGGGDRGGNASIWGMLIGFGGMVLLALTAARARYAWGRGLLVSGLLCLAMPIAALLFTGLVGAESISKEASQAGRAGAAIGTAIGGGILTFVAGIFGFFLGMIFLIGSYFSLRAPRP